MIEAPEDQWTLIHALREQVRARGGKVACTFARSGTFTFRELDAESDTVAAGLAELGIGPGDRVALLAHNSAEFLLAVLAAHKRRATIVPLNTELQGSFLVHQLRTSKPKVLLVDEGLRDRLDDLPADSKEFGATVVIGPEVERHGDSRDVTFQSLRDAQADDSAVLTPEPSDTAAILYTSGTTGPSKGVLLPHSHCFLFGALQARALEMSSDDRCLVALPMFHVNALFMALGSCLVTGASAYIVPRFSASTWLDEVRVSGATVTNAVGVMAEFIAMQPATDRDRDHHLRKVMAIPVARTWASDFEQRFGVRFVQVYGMTECNIVSFSDPRDPLEPGCTGPVVDSFFDVRIVDPATDRPVNTGEMGEIVVRPRVPSCFMQGYDGMPDQTVDAWRNLWFHTGDAGRLDARGRLYFIDRLKDSIRRRGENISALEVEQALNEHPEVHETAVIGVKVAGAGGEEEIKACVVASGQLDPYALHAWCRDRLPRYAVPRFIEMMDALDKTATGKLRKEDLRRAGVTTTTIDFKTIRHATEAIGEH
jgi:crotonobetaine/carnitine-CoA ligase